MVAVATWLILVTAFLVGFAGMVGASQRAVESAIALVATTRLPPFFVGVTLLAVGTDLPEMANSVAASVTGHGDVNAGDSIGSAGTQITLVLGLLPILAGPIVVPRSGIRSTGLCTVLGLGTIAVLAADGNIGRVDAVVLLACWAAGSIVIYRRSAENQQLTLPEEPSPRGRLLLKTLAALVVVAGSAMVALWAVVGIADELDAPEFLVSFFLASVGTSMPELAFDLTALRRGATAMAVGDVMGSSFVDSTLSIAIGPLFFPTAVTSGLVAEASLAAAGAVLVVTAIMGRVHAHDWRTGMILIGIYGLFFVVLVLV